MGDTARELLERALSLDAHDRASIAGALIESLDTKAEPDAARAWDVEIQRRVQDLENRSKKTIPWSVVRERLFRGFE